MARPPSSPDLLPPRPGMAPAQGQTGGGLIRQRPAAALDPQVFRRSAEQLRQVGRVCASRQWVPAGFGSFSTRLDPHHIAINAAGSNPALLAEEDIVCTSLDGTATHSPHQPSVETPYHTAIYSINPRAGAVIHSHSRESVVVSRLLPDKVLLENYQALTALEGVASPAVPVAIPIFNNAGDALRTSHWVRRYLMSHTTTKAFLIRGFGLFTWGETLHRALLHAEVLEFLFGCELHPAQRPEAS